MRFTESNLINIRKIGFLGISDYGFGYLKRLVESGFYDVLFVTSKSKKVPHVGNLERELQDYCASKKIPYLGNVDANADSFVEICRKTDLCILGGYDKIVHGNFIKAPKYGTINTHFGLIPGNRGCNPVMWAILEGKKQGFTTYFVEEKIDYGEVIDRYELEVKEKLNAYEVYQLLCKAAIDHFLEMLLKIRNKDYGRLNISNLPNTYHKHGMPNDSWISWHWNNEFLQRFSDCLIFPLYPCAKTLLGNSKFEIKILNTQRVNNVYMPGTIIKITPGNKITVATKEGTADCEIIGDSQFKKGDVFTSKVGVSCHPIEIKYNGGTLS